MSGVAPSFVVMSVQGECSHPARAAVDALHVALDDLASSNLWSLSTAELAQTIVSTEKLANRLSAMQVALTAQAESVHVAERAGATSLPAWLRAVADVPVSITRERLRLHQALDGRDRVRAAFAAGEIGAAAARAVCEAVEVLPAEIPAGLTTAIEHLLVETAAEEGVRAVQVRAAEIAYRFAPDRLEREEMAAAERNALRLRLRPDGSVGLRGVLDKEAGALALAVLGPLAAPAPASDGVPDLRDTEARYADALIQVLEVASGAVPRVHGERPHVLVTIGLDTLRQEPGSAPGRLESGAPISAGAARRLSCDATVIPVVLGAKSEPLDVGRAMRLVPAAMRRALIVRDQGCAMPGCERPPSWCDAHHCRPWVDGGQTALSNLVLLCATHHRVVHESEWVVHVVDGLPYFTPPAWLDPRRAPRLHSRYKARGLGP